MKSSAKFPNKIGAVIYCRVSTKEQVENLSLTSQEKVCRKFCGSNDFEVVEVFLEKGESARTTDRTEFQRLLNFCFANKQKIGRVVVYDLTRFSRQTQQYHTIRAILAGYGIRVVSATQSFDDTPEGYFMETIYAGVAQLDNDLRAARTRLGMREAVEAGKWPFKVPLGYLRGGKQHGSSLRLDPVMAPILRRAFERIGSGAHIPTEALRLANQEGLRSMKGKPVNPQSFNNTIRMPVYKGVISVPRWPDMPPMKGDFEPLVDQEVFDQVQRALSGKSQKGKIHALFNPELPFKRFVRCGYCGKGLTGSKCRGRNKKYPYYRCSSCKQVNVRGERLESDFVSRLEQLRPKESLIRLFEAVVLDAWKTKQADAIALAASCEGQIKALTEKRDQLVDAFVHQKVIDQPTYERHQEKIQAEIISLEIELGELRIDELEVETVLAFSRALLSNPQKLWFETPPARRERLLKIFFPAGMTYTKDRKFGTNVTDSIFNVFVAADATESSLATRHGFEP